MLMHPSSYEGCFGTRGGGDPDELVFVTLQCFITVSIQHFGLNFRFSLPSPMGWAPDLKAAAAASQFETEVSS
jgi:hypothetical protein